ncbi:phosphonate metabolism protein/1,5-bisphosphokinase (PRPP-forming) PhnN [Pseudomonas sp. 5P_3.1_Bac2]|uniref:phosphonate metabolism protein/1,5-bisphosphokinase (PRPP-forming) PhnN n=1 Tax=Pseudomonas sp. 5P_3.1_Bac2 TaxID=2971617 RepID=UPI0021C5D1FD|nr:phosphonate metabolism protein/1,5-bisphosphokinase (PRPP-forming) PhnN [Pseudomonas sp. 5P_3.1_Bac2]MCU1715887.1 phosphonate metabolism protein/1,5-bisphosphokinase (PRPP-forming) PhnN [Pseudomonas sp. 5P_3.1_Bac2]
MSGRLIYLMGPSGSGKDSLLQAAQARLAAHGGRVIRRVITRSAEAVGEDAIAISPAEFAEHEAAGAFALSWQANGLAYGIPIQLDEWLAAGQHVLVNGSRAYLSQARQRYPDLLPVLLSVDNPVLRERLLKRGRESEEQIEQRLARNGLFDQAAAEADGVHVLDNSADLQRTADNLLALICASAVCA